MPRSCRRWISGRACVRGKAAAESLSAQRCPPLAPATRLVSPSALHAAHARAPGGEAVRRAARCRACRTLRVPVLARAAAGAGACWPARRIGGRRLKARGLALWLAAGLQERNHQRQDQGLPDWHPGRLLLCTHAARPCVGVCAASLPAACGQRRTQNMTRAPCGRRHRRQSPSSKSTRRSRRPRSARRSRKR